MLSWPLPLPQLEKLCFAWRHFWNRLLFYQDSGFRGTGVIWAPVKRANVQWGCSGVSHRYPKTRVKGENYPGDCKTVATPGTCCSLSQKPLDSLALVTSLVFSTCRPQPPFSPRSPLFTRCFTANIPSLTHSHRDLPTSTLPGNLANAAPMPTRSSVSSQVWLPEKGTWLPELIFASQTTLISGYRST